MLHIVENDSCFTSNYLRQVLAGAKDETREAVAEVLKRAFEAVPHICYIGGHHVSIISSVTQRRMVLITGTSPDFSDSKPQDVEVKRNNYVHVREMRHIPTDLNLRYKLCRMIEVGRELHIMRAFSPGYPISDHFNNWKTEVDPRSGAKYSYILVGGKRRFAIEHETAKIFKVSKCGRVDRDRSYGTLDSIENWDWGYVNPQLRWNL